MFDKDSIIGLAQLMEQFYNSEEYKLVQISQRLEELNVAGIFCDIARGFVEKLEEKLVFSADKPYPVVDKRIRVGERVFVESEGHELNNHWVTYFGTDKDGEGRAYVVGRNEHERVHLHGGQFSRGRGLHEIIIDSYLSFVHFMRSAPKEIVMANPFIPLDKDPEVGDLVYVIDGPMKERFCRIENIADDGMYELFTLHRRVHKHLAMTEDGFYVLAPNNGYDSEFFERPFLALEQIAGIVRPVMEEYFASPEVTNRLDSVRSIYMQLSSFSLSGGDDLASIIASVREHKGDLSLLIGSLRGEPFEFFDYYRKQLDDYVKLFDTYKAFGRDLIKQVAERLGIAEDELFTLPLDKPFFEGARIKAKENPRLKSHIDWRSSHPQDGKERRGHGFYDDEDDYDEYNEGIDGDNGYDGNVDDPHEFGGRIVDGVDVDIGGEEVPRIGADNPPAAQQAPIQTPIQAPPQAPLQASPLDAAPPSQAAPHVQVPPTQDVPPADPQQNIYRDIMDLGPQLSIDFGPVFCDNGTRTGDTHEFYRRELTLLDKEGYLEMRYPEDVVRLVKLLDYQIEARGRKSDINLEDIVDFLQDDDKYYKALGSEDLFAFHDIRSKSHNFRHSDFRHPLIEDHIIIKQAIVPELFYLGFSVRELWLIFDHLFPGNVWIQYIVNSSMLSTSMIQNLTEGAEQDPEIRFRMELMARGMDYFASPDLLGHKSMRKNLRCYDYVSNLVNLGALLSLPDTGPHMKKQIEHIYGNAQYNAGSLVGYLEKKLLAGVPSELLLAPPSQENADSRENENQRKHFKHRPRWPGSVELVDPHADIYTLIFNTMNLRAVDAGYAFMRYIADRYSAEIKAYGEPSGWQRYTLNITPPDLQENLHLVLQEPGTYRYYGILCNESMLLEIGRVNASSKTELRHRIRKLEIPHFMMNSRLGQMAALLGALGGGGLLDDPDQKQSVIKEAREACNRPIEYRNRYEGKSMFRLTLHQDVLGHPAALIAGFVEYINTRNALVREQIGSNLALPITSVKYYLPPAVNPSDDKKK